MSLWLDIDFRNYVIRPERCFKQSSEIYYLTSQQCIYKKSSRFHLLLVNFGESAGARTRDPNIKSVVLYLLSYGFSDTNEVYPSIWWCKDSQKNHFSKNITEIY